MDKPDYEEEGLECRCGYATYATSGLSVAHGKSILVELSKCWIAKCLTCDAQWLVQNDAAGRTWRINTRSDAFRREVATLVRRQITDQLDPARGRG